MNRFFVMLAAVILSTAGFAGEARTINSLAESGWRAHAGELCEPDHDDLARKVLGHSVKHTLLLHHNVLNGMFLGDVLQMFEGKGWKLISVEKAYTDPVFSAAPEIVPAGQSIIWALAKESGRFEKTLRYPGEDGEYEKGKMDALGL